jgi:uncharacterized protein YoaH (UPF0181 family)
MIRAIAGGVLLACALGLFIAQPVSAASQVGDAWDQMKTFTVEKKQAAVEYGKTLVRETDEKIKELEAQAATSSGEAKAAQERSIKELKEKRTQTATKLDDMSKTSGNAWDATKQGFADAYKDLSQTFNRTVDSFKK